MPKVSAGIKGDLRSLLYKTTVLLGSPAIESGNHDINFEAILKCHEILTLFAERWEMVVKGRSPVLKLLTLNLRLVDADPSSMEVWGTL
ncbi:MAG: hypothetical protein ACFCBU_08815 [Cyanophyceae cyanobacterium]